MSKKLYLSRNDKKLAGVCGGIAEYFDIDSTLVRLLWILFTLPGGAGLIVYIVAAVIMNEPPSHSSHQGGINLNKNEAENIGDDYDNTDQSHGKRNKDRDNMLIGGILVALGAFFLSRNLFNWSWLSMRYLWPLILIGIGAAVLFDGRK